MEKKSCPRIKSPYCMSNNISVITQEIQFYYFWISSIFFLKNGNDILMYVTHIWTFIGKFKGDGG